jgi:hypothetical protein
MPRQLRTDELTQEIRAKLWAIIYSWPDSLTTYGYLEDEALVFARAWYVSGEHMPLDEFNTELRPFSGRLKQRFFQGDFTPLFDFIEFVISSRLIPAERKEMFAQVFEECLAGWRIVGEQLVPFASEEEAQAIGSSLAQLESTASKGVKAHLRKSAEALSTGRWADSARESVHAMEAAARAFDEKKTLGEIIKALQVRGKPLHPALARSLSSLYGYAGDEKGIRHSLVDEADAAVGEDEALLLYGLSVSFALYLVRLRREIGSRI